MRSIDRRALLCGAAAALTGCATQSEAECDPREGGTVDYFRCRDQYASRRQGKTRRVNDAQSRIASAQNEQRRLQGEAARLEATLARTRAEIARLRATEADLNRRLSSAGGSRATIEGYVNELDSFFALIDSSSAEALAFTPPPELSEAGATALRQRYEANRRDIEFRRANARAARQELAQIWGRFTVNAITQTVALELIKAVLQRLGLGVLNPLIAFAATVADIFDLINTIRASIDAQSY